MLTDGGVYDNMGLETAWKNYRTILVSNGGGKMQASPEPASDWARHALRINDIIDNQVRSLRTRQVIGAFEAGDRQGAYWEFGTAIDDFHLPDALPCPEDQTLALAGAADPLETDGQRAAGAIDQLGLRRLRRRHPSSSRPVDRAARGLSVSRERCWVSRFARAAQRAVAAESWGTRNVFLT